MSELAQVQHSYPQVLYRMAYGLPDWLTGSSSPSKPKLNAPQAEDGGYIAPDRTKREMCYDSRDILFKCLDKNDILDAVKEDEKSRKVCAQENAAYERDCARSWVCDLHFGM